MKNLIYYPSFEIYDPQWLKFALLYFDSVSPIIPRHNMKSLTDTFHLIREKTDFYKPISPDGGTHTIAASNDAIDVVKDIINDPYQYIEVFNSINIFNDWGNKDNWTFNLARGKFSHNWRDLIEDYGIGEIHENGVVIDKRLGNLYMTILAHVISDLRGIPLITNNHDLHVFSILTKSRHALGAQRKEIDKIDFTERIIDTILPRGLSNVPISEIIELRKDSDFRNNLFAYHNSIEEMQNHPKSVSPKQFIEKYQYHLNKYADSLISAGFKITKVVIRYLNPENIIDDVEDLFELSKAGYDSFSTLSNSWNRTKVKRHTRKYLLDIRELKYHYDN